MNKADSPKTSSEQEAVIKPRQRLVGKTSVPGDKSISHRALILSSLAKGTSTIEGLLEGEDCLKTLKIMQDLGIKIQKKGEGCYQVQGKGLKGLKEPEDVLDCGNSGTTMRLLTGLLAAQSFYSVLTGDGSLRSRPMARITRPLAKMGAKIWTREDGLAPLSIQGRELTAIRYEQPVASAQVKSCLLLAGLFSEGKTIIVEPAASRDHTERMLKSAGVQLNINNGVITLENPEKIELAPQEIKVPGDISSAAFLIAAALMVEKGNLTIENVGINPTRSGFLTALDKMQANIAIKNTREVSGEPVADIEVSSSPLKAINLSGEIIPSLIDEIPILAVLATQAKGKTVISDAEELRVKETDRLAAIAKELKRLGADISEKEDGLIIKGPTKLKGGISCKSYHDHRIAMALAVAGLACQREVIIENSNIISVSFPNFLHLLEEL